MSFEKKSTENQKETNTPKNEERKIIIEESYGRISEDDQKERRKIVEEVKGAQEFRRKRREEIEGLRKRKEKGELLTQKELALLSIEEFPAGKTENQPEDSQKKINEKDNNAPDKEPNKTEKAQINEDVLGKAKFLNLSKEDLEQIDSFANLSSGKQAFVLEALNQTAVEMAKREAMDAYNKEYKKAGMIGKFFKGFSKESRLSKIEKEELNKMLTAGVKVYGGIITEFSDFMKKSPEVKYEGGKFKIDFLSSNEIKGEKGLNGSEARQINYFNDIAMRLSALPEEYSFKTASKKEQAEYAKAIKEYEEARGNIMKTLRERGWSESKIFSKINETEGNIKLNQFLNNNGDVEKHISRGMFSKKVIAERLAYGAAGYVTRAATMSAFGAVGAPLGAAIFGGFSSGMRARKELKEREVASRRGVEHKGEENKNFVSAENLVLKLKEIEYSFTALSDITDLPPENRMNFVKGVLEHLKGGDKDYERKASSKLLSNILTDEGYKKVQENNFDFNILSDKDLNPDLDRAREKMENSLKARVRYTQDKINAGLVNYGKGSAEAMVNRFNLLTNISSAITKSEMSGFSDTKLEDIKKLTRKQGGKAYKKGELSFQEKAHMDMMGIPYSEIGDADKAVKKNLSVEDRLRGFLNFKGEAISARQKDYIIKKAIKGAAISAGFAVGGYMIRHFAGEWFSGGGSKGVGSEANKQGVFIADGTPGQTGTPTPESTPTPGMSSASSFEEVRTEISNKAVLERTMKNISENIDTVRKAEIEEFKDFFLKENSDKGKIISGLLERDFEILKSGGHGKELMNFILNPDNYSFKDGLCRIEDFAGEKGFDLVLRKTADGVKIGIDGPVALGRYNWGEEGKRLLFKPNADFSETNLKKALEFVRNAADSFYKGPSDYTSQGWSE